MVNVLPEVVTTVQAQEGTGALETEVSAEAMAESTAATIDSQSAELRDHQQVCLPPLQNHLLLLAGEMKTSIPAAE